MRRSLTVTLLIVCIPLLAACASFSGKTKPSDRPDLAVPPPPPHIVPITPEPILEPVADVPAAPSATPTSRPPRTARENPKPAATEAKPEPTKPETPLPEAPPPAAVTPPAPAPQLRTAESSAAEAGVRASIDRTNSLLSNVDYRRLAAPRKKVYDDAKRFIQQAEDALKVGNAVFAQSIASKAEILAKDLSGR